jgi:DNA modification methylase
VKVADKAAAVATLTLEGGKKTTGHIQEGFKSKCGHCGAVRIDAQLGLEPTPEEYVARMVSVFLEVRRVLADDGTLWINLGDSYGRAPEKGGSGPNGKPDSIPDYGAARTKMAESARVGSSDGAVGRADRPGTRASGVKPKDLVGIPWRVAFALQASGWYLRSDIVWAKPNPMPESVTDRPTKAHEYLFLLAKSERYHYNAAAVAEALATDPKENYPARARILGRGGLQSLEQSASPHQRSSGGLPPRGDTRNRRSVWSIPTQPFAGCHFAVMPEALVEPCILAGSAPGDLVLDPFAGACTVGVVALRHGRRFLGIELNPKYAEMARRRILGPMFAEVSE